MKLIIFSLMMILSVQSFGAGGVNGGGSDHFPEDFGSAWFLDSTPGRTIKVCFQKDAASFPMNDKDIQDAFKFAMDSWEKYIQDKSVNESDPEDPRDPASYLIVTKYEILPKCGNEDLAIYLGYTNQMISDVRAKLFDPDGFAHKISYDLDKGWGKGFIWLKGIEDFKFLWDKNDFLNLKGIFIHELGHVFGNDHRDGTIMSSEFSEMLQPEFYRGGFLWDLYKFHMTSIDWSEELVQCLSCKLLHEDGMLWLPGSKFEKETFKYLTGVYPSSEVKTTVQILPTTDYVVDGNYTVSEAAGMTKTYKFTLLLNSMNSMFGEASIFQTTRRWIDPNEPDSAMINTSSSDFTVLSVMGWMEINGRDIPIVFEGKSADTIFIEKYPEDETDESVTVERTYPYRLVALDGKERYVLYTKLRKTNWEEDDPKKNLQMPLKSKGLFTK